ncbi:2-hydroxyacid dehydrogenase [Methyloraptor flagellatus]|uniref:2-hydroxyacid dehydrogenase n=1 Tax=Methyloraptor flagellatus TaxID=3162530 RepID=A0AAU7XA04_9HYPH
MDRATILIPAAMNPLVTEGLSSRFELIRLDGAPDKEKLLAEAAPRIRGIACGGHAKVDAALIDRLPKLEIVSNFGVGYDAVDARHAATRGILVTNTPDVLTEEVADTAFGLLLMTVRELSAAERWVRSGKWLDKPYPLTPTTLRDRTLGIVGLGRIGLAIARRAEAFGVKVAYHNRRPSPDVAYDYYPDVLSLAAAVDTLMIVVPGGDATKHLVGREVLEALGPKGVLINIGRGSVVDEKALVEALRSGTIHSAGLDVFEEEPCFPQELASFERVVLLPHVGSGSIHTRNRMAQLVVDNLVSWFETGKPLTPVAETPFPR